MTCDHDWTLKFHHNHPGEPFEIRPITMSLKLPRADYDFCRAKFSYRVGEQMKPETRYKSGRFDGLTKVDVCQNGNVIKNLLFRPDWVDYGSEYTHIQLHDLHKSLSSGIVDMEKGSVALEDIYTEVFNEAESGFIKDIDFNLPDEQVRTLYGQQWQARQDVLTHSTNTTEKRIEENESEKLLESDLAVNFNKISPQRAIQRLNEKFRLKSWVNRDNVLVVGIPEVNSMTHLAAPDDERVWRLKDPNISHSREPIKSVTVEGGWVDEPGLGFDPTDWFSDSEDVRAYGFAERTDIDYGSNFTVKTTKAKSNALKSHARIALIERMKDQNAGSVELDPDLSGEEVSKLINLVPGDNLQLVPQAQYFDNPTEESGTVNNPIDNPDKVCGGVVNNETYLVSEVEHNVTEGGSWQVHADVVVFPELEITSAMSYFNPAKEEWVEGSEMNDDGSLAGGWFGFESIED